MIEILNYTPFSKGSIIGYVDVKYTDAECMPKGGIIRNILHMQKGDSKWFMYPKMAVKESNPTQWIAYFELPLDYMNKKMFSELAPALEEYLKTNPPKQEDLPF